MNAEELIAEGLRLARASLVLRAGDRGGRYGGYWGGIGVVPPPAGDWRHWVTVDCGWLAEHGFPLRGCLSMYEEVGDALRFLAVAADGRLPPDGSVGTPLFGREELSIPPWEALGVCGSERARRWLEAGGGHEAGEAYDQEYQRRCPLYCGDVYAALGGWHVLWPEMDAYGERQGRLVLWTLRDAEPWVEGWLDEAGRLEAVPRTT